MKFLEKIKEIVNQCNSGKIFTTKLVYRVKEYERGTRARYYIVKRNVFHLLNIPLFRKDETIVAEGRDVYFGYATLEDKLKQIREE